tara:strand:- start:1080 stop:1328 length:249 start_codon:yes stop_codon:yes gene_type:complete
MILYTEKQLEEAWRADCKKRSLNDSPWIKLEEYRSLFEACLDLKISGMDEQSRYFLNTFNIHIPEKLLRGIQEIIDIELDTQ